MLSRDFQKFKFLVLFMTSSLGLFVFLLSVKSSAQGADANQDPFHRTIYSNNPAPSRNNPLPQGSAPAAAPTATAGTNSNTGSGSSTGSKSQFSTQVNEKENTKQASFKDTVKLVRNISDDETQVFFEQHQGLFALDMRNPNAGKYSQTLVKSMKSKKAIEVEWDSYSRHILKVEDVSD